jgi:hypothetical protein
LFVHGPIRPDVDPDLATLDALVESQLRPPVRPRAAEEGRGAPMATREELRAAISAHLADAARNRRHTQRPTLYEFLNRRRLLEERPGETPDDLVAMEILHELLIAGVIAFGNNLRDVNPGWIWVTDYGRRVLAEGVLLAYDPDRFLAETGVRIPRLDAIALQYFGEALGAYNRGLLFASSVMLGVASERLMVLLVEAFGDSMHEPVGTRFRRKTAGRRIHEQFTELRAKLDSRLEELPPALGDDLHAYLDGIFSLIRINRNDAGHPTGTVVARNVLYAHLQAFPTYAERMVGLVEHFRPRGVEPPAG